MLFSPKHMVQCIWINWCSEVHLGLWIAYVILEIVQSLVPCLLLRSMCTHILYLRLDFFGRGDRVTDPGPPFGLTYMDN